MKYVLFNFNKYLNKLRQKGVLSWFDKLVLDCGLKSGKTNLNTNKLIFFTSYITRNRCKVCVEFKFYYINCYCYLCIYKDCYDYVIKNIYNDNKIKNKKYILNNDNMNYKYLLEKVIDEMKCNIDLNSNNFDKEFKEKTLKTRLTKYAKREFKLCLKNNYISFIFLILYVVILSFNYNYILNGILIFLVSLFSIVISISMFKYIILLSKILKDIKILEITKIKSKVKHLNLSSYKYFGDFAMVDHVNIFLDDNNNYLIPYCTSFFNFIPNEETTKFKLMEEDLKKNNYEFIFLKNTKLVIYVDINFIETIYKYKDNSKYSPKYSFLPEFKEFLEVIS